MGSKKFGVQAWFVWCLASCFVFYKYIIELSPGVLKADIGHFFSLNDAQAGLFISLYYFAYAFMQLPIGLLLDRFGPKKVLLLSLFICLVGTLLMSWLPPSAFGLACVARFLTGVGAASAIIGCMKLIANWFGTQRFARMTGLMMTIGMVGAGLSVDIITAVHENYSVPWDQLLRWVGYIGSVLLLLYFLLIKDAPDSHDLASKPQLVSFKRAVVEVLKEKQSWLLSLYSGLMFGPFAAFLSWGIKFIQLSSVTSHAHATTAVSCLLFGFAFGSPLWGWWSDVLMKRKPFLWLSSIVCLLLSMLVTYVSITSFLFIATLFLLMGFFLSAFVISFSMIREIHPLPCSATSVGFMNTFNSFCNASLVWMIGLVLKGLSYKGNGVISLSHYRIGMSLSVVFIVLALSLLPFISETYAATKAD